MLSPTKGCDEYIKEIEYFLQLGYDVVIHRHSQDVKIHEIKMNGA
jgi:hypothetical protein